jgi:hypothetical protein
MYRVCTEQVGDGGYAERLAADWFKGFTCFRGTGCWRGVFESSQVFEIDTVDEEKVFRFARALKEGLKQEAVLVVNIPSTGVLV